MRRRVPGVPRPVIGWPADLGRAQRKRLRAAEKEEQIG